MVLSSAIVCDHDRRIADDRRPYCDLRSYGNQPLVFACVFFFFFFFSFFFCIGEDGTEVSVFVIHVKESKITYFTRTNSTTSTTTCHKELPNLKFSMFGTPNLEFLNVWHGNLEFSLLVSPILEFSISGPPHVEFQCLA